MSILDSLDIRPLQRIYVVANTPVFLYKHLREIPGVRALADGHHASELVTAFNEHATRVPRTADDVVRAYAALVAMSHLEPAQVRAAIEPGLRVDPPAIDPTIRVDRLNWGRAVLDLVLALYRPITRTTLVAPQTARIAEQPHATNAMVSIGSAGSAPEPPSGMQRLIITPGGRS